MIKRATTIKVFEPIGRSRKKLHAKKARKLLPECSYRGKRLTLEEGKQYDKQLLDLGIKCITCTGERHEYHCQLHQFTNFGKCHGCTDRTTQKLATCPPIPTPAHTPTSNLLVITVATTQQGSDLHSVTGPTQRAYAQKCGADYVAITGDSIYPAWTMFDKFRIHPYLKLYERILYLDADVVIRPNCPNMFEIFSAGVLHAHDDTPFIQHDKWDWYKEVREVALSQKLPIPDRQSFCMLNSGVVLMDSSHAGLWAPSKFPIPTYWCSEQNLETIRMVNSRTPWTPLPRHFNWQWWIGDHLMPDAKGQREAFIVHGAGITGYGGTPQSRIEWLQKMMQFG